MNILEEAYYDDLSEPNDALLAQCALVNKQWSFLSQKLLFRRVTLRSETAFLSFQNAVDRCMPRGRMLGNFVTRMRVVLDENQPFPLSQHAFASAVILCPNLYELSVALYGRGAPGHDIIGSPDALRMQRDAPSFDNRTLALLRSGPAIAALEFSNWSSNASALSQLLQVWPSLRCLDISGTPPQAPCGGQVLPFECALRELRTNFQTPPSVDFMKWLLHNSTKSLQVLEFERQPSAVMLDYLAAEHGKVLQSLAMPTCVHNDGAAAIRKFEALREFRTESPWVAPAVHKSLSTDRLQHLAFGVDKDTPLLPVLQTIRRSEGLEVVTLHLWNGGDGHPQLSAIKIACALQGIDLKITRDVQKFRALTVSYLHYHSVNNIIDDVSSYSEEIRSLLPRIQESSPSPISVSCINALQLKSFLRRNPVDCIISRNVLTICIKLLPINGSHITTSLQASSNR